MIKIKSSKLKIIKTPKSTVMKLFSQKFIKKNNINEIYSSKIREGTIRAWKKSTNSSQNITVISGKIKLVIIKDLKKSLFYEIKLSLKNFQIIHIPKNFWYGFKCLSKEDAIILNAIDITYNKSKSMSQKYFNKKFFNYEW